MAPLPNTPSWRCAQFRKEAHGQLYLNVYLYPPYLEALSIRNLSSFLQVVIYLFHLSQCQTMYSIRLLGLIFRQFFFLTEHYDMKAYWGTGCMTPLIP